MNTPLISYQSFATTAIAEGPISVTKPSGLAVGDVMFIFLGFSTADTVSTPSGWTLVRNTSDDFAASTRGAIFYKVATSGDVAASTFSFDVADTTGSLTGTIVRISGVDQTTPFESISIGSQVASTTTRSHTVSTTPTNSTSILLAFCSHKEQNTIGPYSSTGSPTWTELSEQVAFSNNRISVVYAPYTSTTTITNFSFDVAQSAHGDTSHVILFVVRTAVDSIDGNTFMENSPSFFTQNGQADSNSSSQFLEVSPVLFSQQGSVIPTPTQWSNTDKPVTTWKNPDK